MDFYAAKESTVGVEAMEKYGVKKSPTLVVLKGEEAIIYDGQFLDFAYRGIWANESRMVR